MSVEKVIRKALIKYAKKLKEEVDRLHECDCANDGRIEILEEQLASVRTQLADAKKAQKVAEEHNSVGRIALGSMQTENSHLSKSLDKALEENGSLREEVAKLSDDNAALLQERSKCLTVPPPQEQLPHARDAAKIGKIINDYASPTPPSDEGAIRNPLGPFSAALLGKIRQVELIGMSGGKLKVQAWDSNDKCVGMIEIKDVSSSDKGRVAEFIRQYEG